MAQTPTQRAVRKGRDAYQAKVAKQLRGDLEKYQAKLVNTRRSAKLQREWLVGAIAATKHFITKLKLR